MVNELNQLIIDVKKQYFPELKNFFCAGMYIHIKKYYGAKIPFVKIYTHTKEDYKCLKAYGLAVILMANHLKTAPEEVKRAAVIHELSHIVIKDYKNERKVDDEVIHRGAGKELFKYHRFLHSLHGQYVRPKKEELSKYYTLGELSTRIEELAPV